MGIGPRRTISLAQKARKTPLGMRQCLQKRFVRELFHLFVQINRIDLMGAKLDVLGTPSPDAASFPFRTRFVAT